MDQLAAAYFPGTLRTSDEDDRAMPVRVVAIQPSFAGYLDPAFDQIRVSGEGNVAVYLRLLAALGTPPAPTTPARRDALRAHVGRIGEAAARPLDPDLRARPGAHPRQRGGKAANRQRSVG